MASFWSSSCSAPSLARMFRWSLFVFVYVVVVIVSCFVFVDNL